MNAPPTRDPYSGLRTVMREELFSLCWEPPAYPCNLDAEHDVLSGVINGDVTVEALHPLAPEHFYSQLNGAIFRAAEGVLPDDLETIRSKLTAAGWRGALEEELVNAGYAVPFRNVRFVEEQAKRITELWKRRELMRRLHVLLQQIRNGDRSAEQAMLELGRLAK